MSATTLEKFGYMLETPPYPTLLEDSSDNAMGDADNQQGSRSADEAELTPQRLHAELLSATVEAARAYVMGACHDATLSQRHATVRFGQSETDWLESLSVLLAKLGQRSWMYREGRRRRLWILETSAKWTVQCTQPESTEEAAAYARGFFDAEGGVPHDASARFYIQLVQKSRSDLAHLREVLEALGIRCGDLHNPSVRVDPRMWRFYVLAASRAAFVERVSSWHLPKRRRLDGWYQAQERMKI